MPDSFAPNSPISSTPLLEPPARFVRLSTASTRRSNDAAWSSTLLPENLTRLHQIVESKYSRGRRVHAHRVVGRRRLERPRKKRLRFTLELPCAISANVSSRDRMNLSPREEKIYISLAGC